MPQHSNAGHCQCLVNPRPLRHHNGASDHFSASMPSLAQRHNITTILSGRWGLAEFSCKLTTTGLEDDINNRNTVMVLAMDDAHIASLKACGLPSETLRQVLYLHVLVDYYDDVKLHCLPVGSADVCTLL